jgi:hypothetical protein
MTEFKVSDRVLAVIPGQAEFEIVEGFITAIEQDGRIVAVRPASPDEWEGEDMHDDPSGLSWWWDAENVFHVVEAEKAVEAKEQMSSQWQDAMRLEFNPQGGDDDELGVDL